MPKKSGLVYECGYCGEEYCKGKDAFECCKEGKTIYYRKETFGYLCRECGFQYLSYKKAFSCCGDKHPVKIINYIEES